MRAPCRRQSGIGTRSYSRAAGHSSGTTGFPKLCPTSSDRFRSAAQRSAARLPTGRERPQVEARKSVLATITTPALVARLGARAYQPLVEQHFGGETNITAVG